MAARAGALYTVVTNNEDGETSQRAQRKLAAQIHGRGKIEEILQSRFWLARVSPSAKFKEKGEARLAYTYNATKVVVSLGQAPYSIFTLYRSRRPNKTLRIGRFRVDGAAIRSNVNQQSIRKLDGTNIPQNLPRQVIRSSLCSRKRGSFQGTVGTLEETEQEEQDMELRNGQIVPHVRIPTISDGFIATIILAIPLAINAAMTHFRSGSSTKLQWWWMLGWLAQSVFVAIFEIFATLAIAGRLSRLYQLARKIGRSPLWVWAIPPVMSVLYFSAWVLPLGGFVIVATMVMEYGVCVRMAV